MLGFLKDLIGSSEVIGIDLGTTNSVVAVLEGGKPKIIETPEGGFTLPSVVGFAKDGAILVGEPALRQLAINPKTIYSSKRFIGRDFETVKKNGSAWAVPFVVRPSYDGVSAAFEIDGVIKSPEEIAAEILKTLKSIAEKYLGKTVKKAVITVPAYFNDRQRQCTIDAAKIAGLEVEALINEPTAAALAYGHDLEDEQTIGVYDLGGGTYDFSILKIKNNSFEVITTGGNPFLGGDNFDEVLMQKVLSKFSTETGFNLAENKEALARVKEAVVKAKIELSQKEKASIVVPFLMNDPKKGPINLDHDITRAEFEALIKPMIASTIDDMKKALSDAGLKPSDLNHILLVGGSTRIPLVKSSIKAFHGRDPLEGHGVDTLVSAGAAIHGGIIKGEIEAEFIDVTSLSLGLQEIGDNFSVIIEKSTNVPVSASGKFTTTADNQTEALLRIFQGEARKASENHLLGELLVSDIEPRPAGVPNIIVTYTINADNVLEVKAVDETSGKEATVTLKNTGKLDKKEIRRKQKEMAMPEAERKQLNVARAELSKEIKRVEEAAESERDSKAAKALAVRAQEAEKVLEESIDVKDLTKEVKDIKRIS